MAARQTLTPTHPLSIVDSGEYRAGVCNIGPAEIARRRMAGHFGLILSVVLLALLVLVHAPSPWRLLLILPVGLSASGYLQARFHFCANFGSRGVYNFGGVGTVQQVQSAADRTRDRLRALQIGLGSLAIGVVVAVVAVLLPL